MYKLARKHIIISPNKIPNINYLKNLLPVVLIAGFIGLFVRFFFQRSFAGRAEGDLLEKSANTAFEAAETLAVGEATQAISFTDKLFILPYWVWFLAGALIAVCVILVIKWRKLKNEK